MGDCLDGLCNGLGVFDDPGVTVPAEVIAEMGLMATGWIKLEERECTFVLKCGTPLKLTIAATSGETTPLLPLLVWAVPSDKAAVV